jgi:hypothetical protein
LIELNADHTDYIAVVASAEDLTDGLAVIEWVLRDAHEKYTRNDILKNWPEMRDKPHPISLWKWLEQAVAEGRIKRDGEGRPHKPFRYWLRGRERYFFPDLPPIEPPAYTPEIKKEEVEFAEQLVAQGKEIRRRKKVMKGRRS